MNKAFFGEEAINTLGASRFELLCARLLGRKTIQTDMNGTRVVVSLWRGKHYFIETTQH